jgi:flagellar hook assembly protein FlgD
MKFIYGNVVNLLNKKQTPGIYNIKWDGKNKKGEYPSSGVYFYSLSVNDCIAIKKLVIFR